MPRQSDRSFSLNVQFPIPSSKAVTLGGSPIESRIRRTSSVSARTVIAAPDKSSSHRTIRCQQLPSQFASSSPTATRMDSVWLTDPTGLAAPRCFRGPLHEGSITRRVQTDGRLFVAWSPHRWRWRHAVHREGDPVGPRLESHYANKDFWTQAVFFVAGSSQLNKAHVQYLEAKLVARAWAAKRVKLDNGNKPTEPTLSEADRADMDVFLSNILGMLPVSWGSCL